MTREELKAFIGVKILMAIHILPHLANYWSSNPVLSVPSINNIMTSKRYKKLTQMIHVNDNTKAASKTSSEHDKLHKLRPLIEALNCNFSKYYSHSSFLSIDESMIKLKGRSSLKQYMPMKPINRGLVSSRLKKWINY